MNSDEFFWTLILGFGSGRGRILTGIRFECVKVTGQSLLRRALQERFTGGFFWALKRVVSVICEQVMRRNRAVEGPLAAFHDVLLTDGTLVSPRALLEKSLPGSQTNHSKAALRLDAAMSIRGDWQRSFRITSGVRNDGPVLKLGRWVEDRLFIFELLPIHLFAPIARNKSFFLSRLRSSADLAIVGQNRPHFCRAASLVGQRLRDVVGSLAGRILAVRVEVASSRPLYAGGTRRDTQTLRVVGLQDEATAAITTCT